MSKKRSKKKCRQDGANEREEPTYSRPSKSQMKRDMHRYQALGESLIDQKADVLDTLNISEQLRNAIDEAKRLKSREALRRQKQFIGKLMKSESMDEIEEALGAIELERKSQDRTFKRLEAIRTSLLQGSNDAINAVIAEYPEIDRPKLRQLTKRARHEVSDNLPPSAQRQLFRFLRDTHEAHLALEATHTPEHDGKNNNESTINTDSDAD